jgi:hypothetical protein
VSRGRPRHQTSRRRIYSIRQREVRERQVRAIHEDERWLAEAIAFEVEEGLDFESPTSWSVRLDGRSSAA